MASAATLVYSNPHLRVIKFNLLSDSGGNASATYTWPDAMLRGGEVRQVQFVALTAPTALYDITMTDGIDSVPDVLGGDGADLASLTDIVNTAAKHHYFAGETLKMTGANMGNAKEINAFAYCHFETP